MEKVLKPNFFVHLEVLTWRSNADSVKTFQRQGSTGTLFYGCDGVDSKANLVDIKINELTVI